MMHNLYKRLIRPLQFWVWRRIELDTPRWAQGAAWAWLTQHTVPRWDEDEL